MTVQREGRLVAAIGLDSRPLDLARTALEGRNMARTALALLLGAAALLGGCAIIPHPRSAAEDRLTELKWIRYESGPCSTLCPVYRVTVGADGKGLFEGVRYTAVAGRHRFAVPARSFSAFAAALEPVRPKQGPKQGSQQGPKQGPKQGLSPYDSRRGCVTKTPGSPSVRISWRGRAGSRQALLYDFGCNAERNRGVSDRIGQAPSLLPIGALIGPLP